MRIQAQDTSFLTNGTHMHTRLMHTSGCVMISKFFQSYCNFTVKSIGGAEYAQYMHVLTTKILTQLGTQVTHDKDKSAISPDIQSRH